jgi:hypothetical protein
MELAIRIVENDAARNFQYPASCGKFLAPHGRQFLIVTSAAAIGSRLSGRKADNAGFDASFLIQTQRSAEAAGFVIRMRGYNHHA